MQIFINKRENT